MMPTSLRVVQVLSTGGLGGVETHVAQLTRGLRARGARITVICGGPGRLVERLRADGHDVRIVPMRRRTDLAAVRAMTAVFRDEGVDLVHTHGPLAGILGRHAARRAGRPAVHTLHGLGVLDELRRPGNLWHRMKLLTYRWHERWLNNGTAAIIAVSPAVSAAAVRAGHVAPDRIRVVPHGVPVADGAGPLRPLVVYIGRLHAEKGVLDLLAAFAEVRRALPEARLRIAGDGPQLDAVRQCVQTLGLAGAVAILGVVDAPAALDGAGCFVLPSYAEGLSYALLEAMARGIPCVATAVGGTVDLVEEGRTGLLVPPGRPADLAAAILTVLRDRARAAAMGAAGREVVRVRFTPEQMIAGIAAVYDAVLQGATP